MSFSLGKKPNYELPLGSAPSTPLRPRGSQYDLGMNGNGVRPSSSIASLRSMNSMGNMNMNNPYPNNNNYNNNSYDDSSSSSFSYTIKKNVEKFDAFLGQVGAPIKPFLPIIGRFFIVATFYEDGLRIFSQWNAQVSYIATFRGLNRYFTMFYLALNIFFMMVASSFVVAHKQLIYAVGSLTFVVISQAFVYGLVLNLQFFFRNMSVIGGLLMVLSDAFVRDRRALSLPGLPLAHDKSRAKYFQLAGRVLLILLYFAYVFTWKGSVISIIVSLLGFGTCVLVAIGYKARLSASILVVMLFIKNFTSNPYWKYDAHNPVRDFLRYEHFQILSIIGGLLLIVNAGAGELSIDEKKKIY